MGDCREIAALWRAEVERARSAPLSLADQEEIVTGFEPMLLVALADNPAVPPQIQRGLASQSVIPC